MPILQDKTMSNEKTTPVGDPIHYFTLQVPVMEFVPILAQNAGLCVIRSNGGKDTPGNIYIEVLVPAEIAKKLHQSAATVQINFLKSAAQAGAEALEKATATPVTLVPPPEPEEG
jgi:hypothetical protein